MEIIDYEIKLEEFGFPVLMKLNLHGELLALEVKLFHLPLGAQKLSIGGTEILKKYKRQILFLNYIVPLYLRNHLEEAEFPILQDLKSLFLIKRANLKLNRFENLKGGWMDCFDEHCSKKSLNNKVIWFLKALLIRKEGYLSISQEKMESHPFYPSFQIIKDSLYLIEGRELSAALILISHWPYKEKALVLKLLQLLKLHEGNYLEGEILRCIASFKDANAVNKVFNLYKEKEIKYYFSNGLMACLRRCTEPELKPYLIGLIEEKPISDISYKIVYFLFKKGWIQVLELSYILRKRFYSSKEQNLAYLLLMIAIVNPYLLPSLKELFVPLLEKPHEIKRSQWHDYKALILKRYHSSLVFKLTQIIQEATYEEEKKIEEKEKRAASLNFAFDLAISLVNSQPKLDLHDQAEYWEKAAIHLIHDEDQNISAGAIAFLRIKNGLSKNKEMLGFLVEYLPGGPKFKAQNNRGALIMAINYLLEKTQFFPNFILEKYLDLVQNKNFKKVHWIHLQYGLRLLGKQEMRQRMRDELKLDKKLINSLMETIYSDRLFGDRYQSIYPHHSIFRPLTEEQRRSFLLAAYSKPGAWRI